LLLLKKTFFGKPEIRKTSMALAVNKHIFRFDVSVHDSIFVEVLDGNKNFSEVNASLVFWQLVVASRHSMLLHQ
jgi:hypothetical protein